MIPFGSGTGIVPGGHAGLAACAPLAGTQVMIPFGSGTGTVPAGHPGFGVDSIGRVGDPVPTGVLVCTGTVRVGTPVLDE